MVRIAPGFFGVCWSVFFASYSQKATTGHQPTIKTFVGKKPLRNTFDCVRFFLSLLCRIKSNKSVVSIPLVLVFRTSLGLREHPSPNRCAFSFILHCTD